MGGMRLKAFLVIFALFSVIATADLSAAGQLESRYATIIYDSDDLLKEFNSGVRLGSLSYLMGRKSSMTISDEVKNKIDVIVEKVQIVLEMFPKPFKYKVMLVSSAKEVRKIYRSKYNRDVDFISFYSPGDRTVYISTDDVNLRIFGHETAHAVIDQYFKVSPAVKIHEMLAKYAEAHLED
jgi:hypothetical protein